MRSMPAAGAACLSRSRSGSRTGALRPEWWGLVLVAAHVPLALLAHQIHWVAWCHGIGTIVAGVAAALAAHKRSQWPAYIAAYIAGSEILWRVCEAGLYYEAGKYALTLVLLIGAVRTGKAPGMLAPAYFVLLLPSAVLTLTELGLFAGRSQISFNLSGPLALAAAVIYFQQRQFSGDELRRMLTCLVAPVAGMAAIVAKASFTGTVTFTEESNKLTSGGFGPNQVAGALSLGALAALYLLLHGRLRPVYQIVAGLAVVLTVLAAVMTFSRGGLYTFVPAALALAACSSARAGLSRLRTLAVMIPLVALPLLLVVPLLNDYTGGMLGRRFQSVDASHRDELVWGDLKLALKNPVFGVGPGLAKFKREATAPMNAAHTEFSRMLGEHGILGAAALALLLAMLAERLLKSRPGGDRALAAAFAVWSGLFMLVNAMRLAAPAFAWGLACARLAAEVRPLRVSPPARYGALRYAQAERTS